MAGYRWDKNVKLGNLFNFTGVYFKYDVSDTAFVQAGVQTLGDMPHPSIRVSTVNDPIPETSHKGSDRTESADAERAIGLLRYQHRGNTGKNELLAYLYSGAAIF